jgi:hypothetical protein
MRLRLFRILHLIEERELFLNILFGFSLVLGSCDLEFSDAKKHLKS